MMAASSMWFSSSGGSILRAARPWLGRLASWGRQLSTGRAACAGVAVGDEAVFSQDHVEMREALNKFIEREINPFVNEWEKAREFPAHELFKKLGSAGFLGVNRDPEYGGLGLDYSYNIALAEEYGNIRCSAVGMAIGVQSDMAVPALARFGSNELKKNFLAPSIAGDFVACLGVSEPGAGSDVASIRTNAKPKKDSEDLVINGSKMWTTNGAQADWICLLATTGEGEPHRNKSLICVPMDTPGITVARKIEKLGNHCSDTAEIFFEDVVVPASNVIGEQGKGFTYQMLQFQEERMWVTASVLLPMERAIQETADYCRQRKAFGQSILDNQVVHFRLAELETEVETLRSLLYRMLGLYLKGHDVTKLASMGKLKSGRLIREAADSCLQYWGGMGYTEEVEISRLFRDGRLVSIGGGADEVMLGIICKLSGTLPKGK